MTIHETLELLAEKTGERWLLRAPRAGRTSLSVTVGATLSAGAVIGTLDQLRTRYQLALPSSVPLVRVAAIESGTHQASVPYNGAVIACTELRAGIVGEEADAEERSAADFEFRSPMAGQLYLRPSPDEEPFVEPGDVVSSGDQIGLVEVMKFFYPLALEAPAGSYRLIEFRANDSTSIDAGTVIAAFERVK